LFIDSARNEGTGAQPQLPQDHRRIARPGRPFFQSPLSLKNEKEAFRHLLDITALSDIYEAIRQASQEAKEGNGGPLQ